MKAIVKKHREPGLWLEDVPLPTIGINDVLIQVLRTGTCGTDVHIYKWDAWAQKTIPVPMVVGHEFVGRIVEVGTNVHDFHPGEIVSGAKSLKFSNVENLTGSAAADAFHFYITQVNHKIAPAPTRVAAVL